MRKKFLKRLVAIATVATLTVGSFSTAYGREHPRGKDFIGHHHKDEVTEQYDDSQLEGSISSNEQNETSVEPVDVVYEDFELGNTTSKILKGGLCASYGELDYYAQNDGLLLIGEDREGIITTDIVTDINVMEDTLYYVTVQDEKFIIKKSDLYCEESEIIYESDDEIEMMYVINNEEVVYLSDDSVYKLDIATGEQTTVCEGSNTSSFIPTQYGLILGCDVDGETVLSVGGKELFEAQNFYTEDGYLVYDYEYETKQTSLTDLFSKKFEQKKHTKEFNLHGKYNFYDLVENESHEHCEECLNRDENSEENELALDGISTYATLSRTSSVASYSISTYSADALTEGQKNIVKRARQMVEFTWTPLSDISAWRNNPDNKFLKNNQYEGVPYGWCTTRGSWLGFNTSLDAFANYIKNGNSLLYTNTAYDEGEKAIAPYYSNDCSTFLSYCWNLPNRKTTTGLVDEVKVTKITDKDNSILEVGDCLNKKGSHVVLVADKKYDEAGNLIGYVIMEQTPPKAKASYFTLVQISSYFSNGYVAYRYDNRNSVTYEHCCSVPLDDDKCSDCDYNPSIASTMKISAYTCPSSLTVGQSFSIKGTISSNYKISNVAINVYSSSGNVELMAIAAPYSNSYDLSELDSQIKFGTLSKGNYAYSVIATDTKGTKTLLYSWFSIGSESGSSSSSADADSILGVTGYTCPSTLMVGQSFSLKGTISSNYTISKVTISVTKLGGTTVISESVYPNSKSYNISNIDAKIKFGTLSSGAYLYKVEATDTKGTKTLIGNTFMVYDEVSTLNISGYNYPSSITKGSSFVLKGTISSNYTISKVTVGIYTTAGTPVIAASAAPNAKSYSVSKLDSKITFGKLAKGTYVYKVIAIDAKQTKTLVEKTFTVK